MCRCSRRPARGLALTVLLALGAVWRSAATVLEVATVASGRELVLAFANPSVLEIRVTTHIFITNADWLVDGLSSPVLLARSVRVVGVLPGTTAPLCRCPCETASGGPLFTLDWGFVANKVSLGEDVWLCIDNLAMQSYRATNQNQLPGFDFTALSLNTSSLVRVANGAVINRLCYPADVIRKSVPTGRYMRPPYLPGNQTSMEELPEPDTPCVNTTGMNPLEAALVPFSQRCWAVSGLFRDIAMPSILEVPNGASMPTLQFIQLVQMMSLCTYAVDMACMQALGPVNCWTITLARLYPRASPALSPASGEPSSGLAALAPLPDAALAPTTSSGETPVWAAVVGAVGGAFLVALLAVLALVLWRRSRRPRGTTKSTPAGTSLDEEEGSCKAARTCGEDGGGSGKGAPDIAHRVFNSSSLAPTADSTPSSAATDRRVEGGESPPADAAAVAAAKASSGRGGTPSGYDNWASPRPDPYVVVTPFTPHRPDVNLQLVALPPGSAGRGVGGGGGDGEWACRADSRRNGTGSSNGDGNGGGGGACAASVQLTLLPVVRGKGSFGRVVEGLYGGQRVAVKMMPSELDGGDGDGFVARSFAQEVEVLGRCAHPNVVRLLAACLQPPRMCLVMELMDMSLEAMIFRAPGCLLPMDAVISIALDTARGLAYLHPTIVHRDLKPANILVNCPLGPNQVAKITDFGLSRLRTTVLVTRSPEAGTPPYTAPECFDTTATVLTHHVDMYSLGCVLWTMLSGQEPWKSMNYVRIAYRVTFCKDRLPLTAIPLGRRPQLLLRLMQRLWDADPHRRPAAAEVVYELEVLREQMANGSCKQAELPGELPDPAGEAAAACGQAGVEGRVALPQQHQAGVPPLLSVEQFAPTLPEGGGRTTNSMLAALQGGVSGASELGIPLCVLVIDGEGSQGAGDGVQLFAPLA